MISTRNMVSYGATRNESGAELSSRGKKGTKEPGRVFRQNITTNDGVVIQPRVCKKVDNAAAGAGFGIAGAEYHTGDARVQHVEQRELEAVPDARDLLERERRLVELPVGDALADDARDHLLEFLRGHLPQRAQIGRAHV